MKIRNLNDNKVTVSLNLSVGTLGKSRKDGRDLSDKVVQEILNFYADIEKVWLLTGEGEMLKSTEKEMHSHPVQNDDFVPLFYKVANAVEKIAASNQELTSTNKILANSNSELVNKLGKLMDEINLLRMGKTAKYPTQEEPVQIASDIERGIDM